MKERIILHIDVNNAFLSWTAVDMIKNGHKIDIRKNTFINGKLRRENIGYRILIYIFNVILTLYPY